jgi:pSer/pThr/pTyr-binding forkhead associated (FHA) protein
MGSLVLEKDEALSMKVRLIALSSVERDRKLGLSDFPVVLGRSIDADITIEDRWVSRRHCELLEREGMVLVRDLDSTHGTFVNGKPILEAYLRPEDILTIGLTSFSASYRPSARFARVS